MKRDWNLAVVEAFGRSTISEIPLPWWRLLYHNLSNAHTMQDNPLLKHTLRRYPILPKWRPNIGSLWIFPLLAVGAVVLIANGLGKVGGASAAVSVGFAAALCLYPLYAIGGAVSWLIPTRVAPTISSEIDAQTLDMLRLTRLSTSEIMIGKLLGALLPFAGLFSTVGTFFVLIALLGVAGAGAIPVVLGLSPADVLPAIILVEVPVVFGPLVNIFFVSALSLTVSAYTAHPESSIFAAYGVLLAYWIVTTMVLVMILTVLLELELITGSIARFYVFNPLTLLLPNALRVTLSALLTPILFHMTMRRIRSM